MGPISDLATELMQRELVNNPNQFKVERKVDRNEPGMSPQTLATIGGLLDAASTYTFMKRGNLKESNPLVNGIANGSPELTGLTAVGGLLASKAATKLIGKKWPKLADALAANLGAEQLGLGVQNFISTFKNDGVKPNSAKVWHDVMDRNKQRDALMLHQSRSQ